MAGLGRRTFAPGEVLTASNVMNYLQDQTVMNFAGTAARGSAIGTAVSEGMVSYLADSNLVEAYDGSAWKQISSLTGGILQVIYGDTTTEVLNNSTTTYADTTLSASITPKSTSSKVAIFVAQAYRLQLTSGAATGSIKLVRGSTDIWLPGQNFQLTSSDADTRAYFSLVYLDSPNTTSDTTYKTQFNRAANSVYVQSNSTRSSIILMEVAG
jgi:hypothetical protein